MIDPYTRSDFRESGGPPKWRESFPKLGLLVTSRNPPKAKCQAYHGRELGCVREHEGLRPLWTHRSPDLGTPAFGPPRLGTPGSTLESWDTRFKPAQDLRSELVDTNDELSKTTAEFSERPQILHAKRIRA
mgnify:CR=1 FL=1